MQYGILYACVCICIKVVYCVSWSFPLCNFLQCHCEKFLPPERWLPFVFLVMYIEFPCKRGQVRTLENKYCPGGRVIFTVSLEHLCKFLPVSGLVGAGIYLDWCIIVRATSRQWWLCLYFILKRKKECVNNSFVFATYLIISSELVSSLVNIPPPFYSNKQNTVQL